MQIKKYLDVRYAKHPNILNPILIFEFNCTVMYIDVQKLRHQMRTVNFTEFRNKASIYLTKVENGETIRIVRHGKTIAEITPPISDNNKIPSWKKKGLRLTAKGKNLSSAILSERETE